MGMHDGISLAPCAPIYKGSSFDIFKLGAETGKVENLNLVTLGAQLFNLMHDERSRALTACARVHRGYNQNLQGGVRTVIHTEATGTPATSPNIRNVFSANCSR